MTGMRPRTEGTAGADGLRRLDRIEMVSVDTLTDLLQRFEQLNAIGAALSVEAFEGRGTVVTLRLAGGRRDTLAP